MGEKKSLDKTSELYTVLPFMEDFPFEEYTITLEQEGIDPKDLGIAPILINTLGTFGTEDKINFFHRHGDAITQIIFLVDDVLYIESVANEVKTLDSTNDELDAAIQCGELEAKLSYVKKSKKFINQLNVNNFLLPSFQEVLEELVKIHEVVLTSEQILGLNKFNLKKVLSKPLSKKENLMVMEFLDFQLHYAKILLGIVIAAKIH